MLTDLPLNLCTPGFQPPSSFSNRLLLQQGLCMCLHSPSGILLLFLQIYVLVIQSCLTLCSHMDCSPPGSSVLGVLQARILKRVAVPFSRGSS